MPASSNPRHWLSPLTTVLFVAMGLTGILMWLHLRVPGVQLLHEVAGLLFTTVGAAHLAFNWRALLAYFRRRTAWVTLLAASALCVVLAGVGLAAGGGEDGGPGRGRRHHENPVRSGDRAPIAPEEP